MFMSCTLELERELERLTCPCCTISYCKPCFELLEKGCCSCGCYLSYRIIKNNLSKQFQQDIKNKQFQHVLQSEYKLMSHTQHYVKPTREIKRINGEIKQIQDQINRLKQQLITLKEEKKEEEFKLCSNYDSKNFRHPCTHCRGFVYEKSCFLCEHACTCSLCESEYKEQKQSQPSSPKITLSASFSDKKEWKRILSLYQHIYPTLKWNEDTFKELRIRFLMEELTIEEYESLMKKVFLKNEHQLEYYYLIHNYLLFVERECQSPTFWTEEEKVRTQVNEWIAEIKGNPI